MNKLFNEENGQSLRCSNPKVPQRSIFNPKLILRANLQKLEPDLKKSPVNRSFSISDKILSMMYCSFWTRNGLASNQGVILAINPRFNNRPYGTR